MPALLALVEGWVGPKFAKPLLYGALALLILALLWGGKCAYDSHVIANHDANTIARTAPATDAAANQRVNDAIANNQTEQEMHHAIAAQPDQPIAPTSHALACERLRRAGRHVAACSGPSSSH